MIAAGIGCRRGAPASDIEAAIRAALARAQIGADALDVVATIEAKNGEPGICATAEKFGVRSIPTLIIFKNGKEADKKVGAASKGDLTRWIGSHA